MTLTEINQAVEDRLAQLQIVGRQLADEEAAEVSALQAWVDAMSRAREVVKRPLVSSNTDGVTLESGKAVLACAAEDARRASLIGRGFKVLGMTVISDPSVPPGEVRFFGDPLGLSSLQSDEPERPPSRGKGYYACAYGRTVGPRETSEIAKDELHSILSGGTGVLELPERYAVVHWYSPE